MQTVEHITSSKELVLGDKALKFFSILGILGSLTVVIFNTIVFSQGDYPLYPQGAVNRAYWFGSMALAIGGLGFYQVYIALRPAGFYWASPPAFFLAFFMTLGSAGHGSFIPVMEVDQILTLSLLSETESALEGLRVELELHNQVLLFTAMGSLAIGSIWYSVTVFFKETLYPKWMGFINIFLITMIVFFLPSFVSLPRFFLKLLEGFGFHLGILSFMGLSLYHLWSVE
ncbi:MAG: hypothetical protein AAF490_25025 [Chloroflexota bacterium]